ncbi:MAG TPA: PAS domain S-box protein, partial [Polyangium sp.]|nr:PAS domain S-box protein [Polyangium sp.]
MKAASKPSNEAERLQALLEANILDTDPEIDFDDVAALIASICSTPIALVSLVADERQWFKAKLGFKFTETPRDVAFCAHAILEPDVFVVPNAIEDERFFDNPLVIGEEQVRFYAGAPITTSEGYNVGEVCVMDRIPRGLSELQKAALRTLARQVATQMEVRRMNHRLNARSQQIEEARRQLDDLLANATDLIVILGSRGQIKYVNRAWIQVLGHDIEQSIGRSIFDMVAPDERARCEILFDDLYAGNVPRNVTIDFISANGQRVTLEGGASVRRDATGAFHGLRVIFRDITERRALEQQRQVFEDLVAHATDAILLWRRGADGSYRLRFANSAARAMSPIPLDRSLGLGMEEIFPELVQRGKTGQGGPSLVALKNPVTYETSIQLGPTTLDLRVSLVPLPGDNLGTIIENIQERKVIERMKNEFVSTVSHELRTPLTSIRGALGLI